MLCWPSSGGPGYFLQQWVPVVQCYFLSSAPWSVIPAVLPCFTVFSPSQETVRLTSFCSPLCCGRPLHISIALFTWVICKFAGATYTDQHLGRPANFLISAWAILVPGFALEFPFVIQCLGSCWLSWAPLFACAGTLALVQLGRLISVYLPYCLLLSRHVSSNYTALDGCQQEEDKTYSTTWDGTERCYSCVREDFILPF